MDGLIGRFLDSLGDPGLDRTTVFVVSDHGFLPSHREIRPNVKLRTLGAEREARFVMNHGAGALYRLDGDLAAVHQLARKIAAMEGERACGPPRRTAPGRADGLDQHAQVADVMFEAAPGYSYGDTAEGPEEHGTPKYLGTHGQRPLYGDNAAFFLAAGAGVRRDVALGAIRSRDVAPTVASVLGLRMDAVEGAVLARMLA